MVLNFLLAMMAAFITYYLSLAIVGEKRSVKVILPAVFIIACCLMISKVVLNSSMPIHILIYTAVLWAYLTAVNKIDWQLTLISSILTILIIVFCSMLISDPILEHCGINLNAKPGEMDWVYINLVEFGPQVIVLILVKISKISLKKFTQ